MLLLVILVLSIFLSTEVKSSIFCTHVRFKKQQLTDLTLTFVRQSDDKSPYFCLKAKQQYKERQLHNGFSDLPWTGISFKPWNKYSRFFMYSKRL